jgi:hypothetical protein
MSAEKKAGGTFESVVPHLLFRTSIKFSNGFSYAVATDAQRFLINTPVEANNPAPMTVVLNWTAAVRSEAEARP